MHEFTLQRFIKRQKIALHGYEERHFKNLPKIIYKICERILKLSGCCVDEFPQSNIPYTTDFLYTKLGTGVTRHESIYSFNSHADDLNFLSPTSIYSPSSSNSDIMSLGSAPPSPNASEVSDALDTFSELDDESTNNILIENKCFHELELHKTFEEEKNRQEASIVYDIGEVVETMIVADINLLPYEHKKKVRQLQEEINSSKVGWFKLDVLDDVPVLAAMLFDWLESLKRPVLDTENLERIVIHYKHPEICLSKLEEFSAYILEYVLIFVSKLQISNEILNNELLKRFLAALTQQYVIIRDIGIASGRGFRKLRDGTMNCALEFLNSLLISVDLHHRQQKASPRFVFNEYKSDDDSDVETGFHN